MDSFCSSDRNNIVMSSSKIFYFANPRAQYLALKDELSEAMAQVLDSDSYILGSQVALFEEEFASYIGRKYAVGVNSGTDALILSMRALNIGEGDEVIIPSFTAVATAAAVVAVGAQPVFIDIDIESYSLNPELLDSAFSNKTKAVIAVHLYGNPAKIREISEWCAAKSLYLIEDCAQAHGAKSDFSTVGTLGVISCFSFYPTKNLGGIGDGGGITTDNEDLYLRLRMLRQYGWAETRNSQIVSQISRLDELQASILRIKLKHLDSNNQKRISLAHVYDQCLDRTKFILPSVREGNTHVFHLYVVRVSNRSRYLNELPKKNIYPGIHYEWPVHLNDAYKSKIGRISGSLLNTELASKTVMSLPMYPELTDRDIQYISEVANNV